MPKWVRVKDKTTGHEFDLLEQQVPSYPGVEPVKSAEVLDARFPRSPQHDAKVAKAATQKES